MNDKKKEVSNGNYLWISYFYSYLNERGRAGFVMAASATDSSNKDREIRHQLTDTGHVDVMLSVGTNFFYTKSLPCTLWFFDKGKPEARQDKVLFIDARNYYTLVDRTLNEWSEWQMKNLNAIVWLYRGETEKFKQLQKDYVAAAKTQFAEFKAEFERGRIQANTESGTLKELIAKIEAKLDDANEILHLLALSEFFANLKQAIADVHKSVLTFIDSLNKADQKEETKKRTGASLSYAQFKKILAGDTEKLQNMVEEISLLLKEAQFLTDCFEDGVYADIPGLCKIAKREEIAEKNYSLTPGAYVGVAEQHDENEVDFSVRMKAIHAELKKLQSESNALMDTISKNFEEMGI